MSSIQKSRFNDITFERLLALNGVNGAILSEQGQIVLNHTQLAEAQMTRLAFLARGLCRGYRKIKSAPSTVLMAYDKSAIMIVSRDDAQLVLLLETKLDIDVIGNAASSYLTKRMRRPLKLPGSKQKSA